MSVLDVRTVMFSHIVTDIVCTAVMAFLWVQNRKRFAGTTYWVLDFACQTAAVLLIVLRGSIPDWISMVVSNTLVVAGALLGYIGLTLFVGKRRSQVHNYILLTVFIAVHLYFIFARPNLSARTLNVSLGLLVMCFQCAWLALRRVERGMRRMTLWVGLVFGVFCLVSVVRIVVDLVLVRQPASNDFFRSGLYDTLLLMSYQLLLILLTFTLALMINQRLLAEIQTQEEKFTKAFRSSPYAITLTRPSDGKMIDVNDGFVTITGYSYAEAVGRATLDLQLWVREEDCAAVVSELSRGKRVAGREYQFRKKSGELVTGLFSAEIIMINDQPWILSSISDITEQKATQAQVIRAHRLESLSTLAGGVAHQFNNINTVIGGNIDFVLQDSAFQGRGRTSLKEAQKGIQRATEITERLLGLSSSSDAHREIFRLDELARSILPLFETRFRAENVSFHLEPEGASPVKADSSQLTFIVTSLLGNALHSLIDRPSRVVSIRSGNNQGFAFLEVRDTGCGILPENLSRIFTPFFSTKGEWASAGSPQAKVKGVGLSLAVCQSVVAEYGGRIEVESEPGVGSTFRLLLPLERPATRREM